MKQIEEWTERDLRELIASRVQESLVLDYKRSDALDLTQGGNDRRNDLVKDVSAFANSAGGRIIYGVIEENQFPVDLDEGVTPSVKRETIEQILTSRIQPRIQGIRIVAIPLESGRNAFVIDVPQATALAPHQAGDKKYYKRYNFMSVAMEDYEVRDAMGRTSSPQPVVQFDWRLVGHETDPYRPTLQLSAYIVNQADMPLVSGFTRVYVDSKLDTLRHAIASGEKAGQNVWTGDEYVSMFSIPYYLRASEELPLFNGLARKVWSGRFTFWGDEQIWLGFKSVCQGYSREHFGKVRLIENAIRRVDERSDDLLFNPEGVDIEG